MSKYISESSFGQTLSSDQERFLQKGV